MEIVYIKILLYYLKLYLFIIILFFKLLYFTILKHWSLSNEVSFSNLQYAIMHIYLNKITFHLFYNFYGIIGIK